jgi:MFS family permease
VSYFLWITGHVYSTLVVFSLIMGIGYGGIAGMAPAVTASLFGVQGLGQLLGVLFTALGLACLVGPPVAGLVIEYSHTFHGVRILCGSRRSTRPRRRHPLAQARAGSRCGARQTGFDLPHTSLVTVAALR